MTAVYFFEDADLGRDSAGTGLDLAISGSVSLSQDDASQGASSVRLFPDGNLVGSFDELDSTTPASLTYGGWIRVSNFTSDGQIIDSKIGANGYRAHVRALEEGLICSIGGGGMGESLFTPHGLIVQGEWVHTVCRYDSTAVTVDAIVNGTLSGSRPVPPIGASNDVFTVGGELDADIDEVFVTKAKLSDTSVRRIYACGLDGTRCECDQDDPALYANCGRRHPSCDGALPPCDQAAP